MARKLKRTEIILKKRIENAHDSSHLFRLQTYNVFAISVRTSLTLSSEFAKRSAAW